MGTTPDFNVLLHAFMREFGCDRFVKDKLVLLLKSSSRENYDDDPKQKVKRFYEKMLKKNPSLAVHFSEISKQLKISGLKRRYHLIAFMIDRAKRETSERLEQRKAKLAGLSKLDKSTLKSTQKLSSRIPALSSAPKVATKVRFGEPEVVPKPILNGRSIARTVVNEKDLIADLLAALSGIEGRYLQLNSEGHLLVAPSCSIDDALHSQFLQILKIGNSFLTLQRLTQESSGDLTTRAFYSYVSEFLTEYSAVLSDLYSEFVEFPSSVTSLKIMEALSEWEIVMKQFILLSKKFGRSNGLEGANFAFSIYSSSVPESLSRRFLEGALKRMLSVFHRSLKQWLLYGSLKEGVSWMIAIEDDDFSANAWTSHYKIMHASYPDIFMNFDLPNKILMIGRSVGLLQSLKVVDRTAKERKRLIDSVDALDFYLRIEEAVKFSHLINRIYDKMNLEVITEIVENYHIRDHLEVVQRHFFLTDEVFARTFFCQLCEISENDFLRLDSQSACRALSEALFLCSSFPSELKDYGYLEATCGVKEKNGQILPSPRDASGCPSIRLRYVASVPVSILLSDSSMDRYNRIFEFLWQVVSIDFCLSEVREFNSCICNRLNFISSELVGLCRLLAAVLVRMGNLLSILRNYINMVVEQCTKKFAAQFDSSSCGDLAKLVDAHGAYLSSIEDQLFFLSKEKAVRTAILATLEGINDAICHFRNFEHEFEHAFESKNVLEFGVGELTCASGDGTKFFELAEEQIKLKDAQENLLNCYKPLAKTAYAKFECQVKDVAASLSNLDRAPQSLLLQDLRFRKFC